MSAKNASAVPKFTEPVVTISKISPPTEYNTPATNPAIAIIIACNFARKSTPIFVNFAIIYPPYLCNPENAIEKNRFLKLKLLKRIADYCKNFSHFFPPLSYNII